MSVSVNPPKTPVTAGSNGIAAATVPNVCKMPGPPAPFVPTPLPNIGKSDKSPDKYSKKVKFVGKAVAIKGATFKSMGDVASKGTGGGLVSANTEGATKFVGPGSMDTKVEGKNVQLLSDPMLNNCGGSGNPPNAATLVGLVQPCGVVALVGDEPCRICESTHESDPDDDNRQVKESGATKGAAGDLQAIAASVMAGPSKRAAKGMKMLAAVECHTGQIFVAVSGAQPKPFLDKMAGKPWHRYKQPGGVDSDPCERFAARVDEGSRDAFREAWKETQRRAASQWETRKRKEKVEEELFNNPGTCGAQLAMLLALEHGNRPKAVTERWPRGGAGVQLYYRTDPADKVGRCGRFGGDFGADHVARLDEEGVPAADRASMGASGSCPPCGTCQVLLTALMCNQKGKPCDHESPASCKCP